MQCSTFSLLAWGSEAVVNSAKMAPKKSWSIFTAISWTRAMKYLHTKDIESKVKSTHCCSNTDGQLPHVHWIASSERCQCDIRNECTQDASVTPCDWGLYSSWGSKSVALNHFRNSKTSWWTKSFISRLFLQEDLVIPDTWPDDIRLKEKPWGTRDPSRCVRHKKVSSNTPSQWRSCDGCASPWAPALFNQWTSWSEDGLRLFESYMTTTDLLLCYTVLMDPSSNQWADWEQTGIGQIVTCTAAPTVHTSTVHIWFTFTPNLFTAGSLVLLTWTAWRCCAGWTWWWSTHRWKALALWRQQTAKSTHLQSIK